MTLIRVLALSGLVGIAAGLNTGTQPKQARPTIAFGGAQVSLGMTVEQVSHTGLVKERPEFIKGQKRTRVSLKYPGKTLRTSDTIQYL